MLFNLLRGQRIRLNALTKDDVLTMVQWEEDTAFLRLLNATVAVPRTGAAISAWVETVDKTDKEITLAIRLLDSGELIGIVGFDGILWANGVAGYFVGLGKRDHWGKGYGYEVTQLAINYAFNELNLHRLQLTVFSYNERAIALYEKCGFKREGAFRDFLLRNDKRYDMILYGMLRHEWRAQNERVIG